jgi:tRNA-specific 2-thiouridylase
LIFFAEEFSGSFVALFGQAEDEDIEYAAKVTARYCKGKDEKTIKVKYGIFNHPLNNHIEVSPAAEDDINKYLL